MASTLDDIKGSLLYLNQLRLELDLGELTLVNSMVPPGLTFMLMGIDGAMRPTHKFGLTRKEAGILIDAQIQILVEQKTKATAREAELHPG